MKVASGVNTPTDSDSYYAGRCSELTMLDQTRALPSATGGLIRRRDASVEELLWSLDYLEREAESFSAKRVAEMRPEAEEIAHAMGEATYHTQLEALTNQHDVMLARIAAVEQRPVLWVQSTRLYRRILKDVNKKLFGRSL
ncbi:MAG: hypothetical protein QG671_4251 [Actinomycetota bacterium]|nr:hypothetical protein [Actinomycetota bacterium]HQZ84301.1 hypothetical protein [Actinomycetota bacterium]